MPLDPEIAKALGLKPEDSIEDAVERIHEWRHRAYRAEKYTSRILRIHLNEAVKEARESYEAGSADNVDVPLFKANMVRRLTESLKFWGEAK